MKTGRLPTDALASGEVRQFFLPERNFNQIKSSLIACGQYSIGILVKSRLLQLGLLRELMQCWNKTKTMCISGYAV